MDINTIGVATVAAIIVICYLIGMIVKATALDNKWIPIICGVCGGIIGRAPYGARGLKSDGNCGQQQAV